MDLNKTFSFDVTFYHHVRYVGECSNINTSKMFGATSETSFQSLTATLVTINVISLMLNSLSIFIFISRESEDPGLDRLPALMIAPIDANARSTQNSSHRPTYSAHRQGTRYVARSTVTMSLFVLCLCECVYSLNYLLFKALDILIKRILLQKPKDSVNHCPPDFLILMLPVVENLVYYLSDVGLMGRNWCVCLITMTRAEVILFPLGSKMWQRVLRQRRGFLAIFSVLLVVSVVMAYVKHADMMGILCYSKSEGIYALWNEDFIMTNEQYLTYNSEFYFMFQTGIVWILLAIFTVIIIAGLKCREHEVFQSQIQSNSLLNVTTSSEGRLDYAWHRRKRNQRHVTRLVLVVVFTFLCLEPMVFILSLARSKGLEESEYFRNVSEVANILVSLDSVTNFIIFFLTVSYFRRQFYHLITFQPCRQGKQMVNADTNLRNRSLSIRRCTVIHEN